MDLGKFAPLVSKIFQGFLDLVSASTHNYVIAKQGS
jgi:hypothetical protein